MIFAIRRLVPGYLHFGTQLSGLSVLDESSGKFVNFKKDLSGANSIIHNTVYDLAYDGKGLIWIATWGGLCSYDIKKPKSSFQTYDDQQGRIRNLYAVHKQKKENTLWLSGVNGLFRFDTRLKQWIPWTSERDKTIGSQVVWVFYEDDQQNIWMGTENNSVIRYHLPSQKVNTIPVGAAGTKNVVRCLKPEGSRYLWIGADNGWMKLDRHTLRIVQHYSTKNGLPDNVVYAMEMDKGGNWWLSTNKGLVVYRKSDRSFRSYDAADGLQGNEFNTKSSYADSSGKLYFGGINGFNVFDPSDLRSNRFAPDVRFTTVKLFDTVYLSDLELDGVGELQLNHRQNFISFEFAALDYSFSEKANYTYVMEGLDDNWLNNGARRYISYTGLKPGHYTFKVKYQNRDGVASNNIAMLRIYISPPWWQTWWAYSLLSCIAAVVVYTAYRRHIGRLQKKQAEQISTMVATQENERRRISRDLHDDIGTKLSAIKLYVSSFRDKLDQQRLDEAKGMAENSEQLINDTMTDLRQMLLNLSPSVLEEFGYAVAVEGLVNKINETKLIHFDLVMFGLKENLHRDYELALYRITQELINNVLKHAEATEVSLQIGYREGKIILMMEDNGKGFDVYSHRDGYGLKNLEARTQLLQGTMVIDSLPGRGTNVLIEIPYKMNGHA